MTIHLIPRGSGMSEKQAQALELWVRCGIAETSTAPATRALVRRYKIRALRRLIACAFFCSYAWLASRIRRDNTRARAFLGPFIDACLAEGRELARATDERDKIAYARLAKAWSLARLQAFALPQLKEQPELAASFESALLTLAGYPEKQNWNGSFSSAWQMAHESGASHSYAPSPELPSFAEIALSALDLLSLSRPLSAEESKAFVKIERFALAYATPQSKPLRKAARL